MTACDIMIKGVYIQQALCVLYRFAIV